MDKLEAILKKNGVQIDKKHGVCLNDVVKKIINSKNADLYMKRVKDKIEVKGKYYVSLQKCRELIKQGKSKKCRAIMKEIGDDDNEDDSESESVEEVDNRSIISIQDKLFQYNGIKFTAFFIPNQKDGDMDIWVKGKEVAEYLKYQRPADAIKDHVDEENKMTFEKLLDFLGDSKSPILKKIDKQTIFINISGFFNLVRESKQPLAKEMRKWIDNEVMPAIVKYGSYSMQPASIDIRLFYEMNTISTFFQKAVLYIGYVGQVNGEFIFKYGLSRNMFKRDFEQHSKHFAKFKVVFIGETDNCEQIEKLFENDVKTFNLYRQLTINGKRQTELFTVSIKYPIDYHIQNMQRLIDMYKLPALKNADDRIMHLTNVVDIQRQSDDLRRMEFQFKMSENYKLEVEKDLKIRELDIQALRLNIELEKEKTKQMVIQAGGRKVVEPMLLELDDDDDDVNPIVVYSSPRAPEAKNIPQVKNVPEKKKGIVRRI